MINIMQLKAKIKNISKEKNISAQLVLQNYMMERFIERIALSDFQDQMIIKGGLLISSIVGLDSRATMDIDMILKGKLVNEVFILDYINEISRININDEVKFDVVSITEIREMDDYFGFRVSLIAGIGTMKIPLKIDITTGDKIIPSEISYEYPLMFENRSIKIKAYNLETILSEKIETIISRGNQNTRMRDFYDVYILLKLKSKNIDYNILRLAIEETSQKRDSLNLLLKYKEIISNIENNNEMLVRWENYRNSFNYARTIDFNEICKLLTEILEEIDIK
ncbi:MAG: nucleotidyl transferase AbiEii/AbiGii toxin family protein [Gemella haemolysans]|uniref:nucleotidyl transferase AbiEii/AbiGii toxin family protein n=1 Tax=Gemella haemolysans TaxID=1379 RepID=UPI0026E9C642|nr:nucleotidyl transferase AbiEii/AbiGii toxin family protein [Gemella haemolysans]MBS5318978.1 nucleotidyl transferase AbiEii/AbiGii toxin family protein [Gemella haemolysans]